ncbi:MAG: hypothetical protein QF637_01685 [Acidimicrobiales bacterium]|jgi:membrane protein DedA with SNARE-associated domain|nr:hypothetical protein [Acidimicrobiales bacterium]
MSEPELPRTPLDDEQRRRVKRLAAFPVALALAAYVGQVLTSSLVDSQPLLLISLNATDPMLLLAAHQTGPLAFLLVGSIRLFAPDLFLHQLGWEFGPATKNYIADEFGKNSGLLRTIAVLERWFPRVGWLLLFLVPGYPMCLLAGIARMRRVPFVAINLAGTLSRLLLIYWVSSVFDGPIGAVVRFISRFSLPFTLLMVLLVVLQSGRGRNRPTGP